MSMSDRIEAFAAFARIMELRSFTAVGRHMRISQSTVSKHIAALEDHFKVQLFIRTTRRLSPTPEAYRILEHVQRMLDALDAAQATIKGELPEATGVLRLTVPRSLARSRLLPRLPAFLKTCPRVTVDVKFVEDARSLVADEFDLAITTSVPKEGSLVSRSVKVFQWLLVASPSYLARRKPPRTPVDLEDHEMILPARFSDGFLEFDSEDGRQAIQVQRKLIVNCEESVYEAALAGRGIAIVPSWLTRSERQKKPLLSLLPDCVLPQIPVTLLYPQTHYLPRRVRMFIDFAVPILSSDKRKEKL
jgi:DNA-binding transcriptional LysR family regulator